MLLGRSWPGLSMWVAGHRGSVGLPCEVVCPRVVVLCDLFLRVLFPCGQYLLSLLNLAFNSWAQQVVGESPARTVASVLTLSF